MPNKEIIDFTAEGTIAGDATLLYQDASSGEYYKTLMTSLLAVMSPEIQSSDASGRYVSIGGVVDGVNQDFDVGANKIVSGTLKVWYSGVLQSGAQITALDLALGTFSLGFAPKIGYVLMIEYVRDLS
jgi:hypothetical protein